MTDATNDDFVENEPAARKALGALGYDAELCDLAWLSGGGAHKNFLVTTPGGRAVLKVWNRMWESVGVLPPSAVILHNTRMAGDIGLGARVLGTVQDPTALMLEFVPSTTLSTQDDGWVEDLAAAARRLHDAPVRFARDYSPFNEARIMLASARQRGADLPEGFAELAGEMSRIEDVLDLRFNEFVPCHNDLYAPNVLRAADGTIRLIDYDLSGNGDRCYDLGFAAAYFEMDDDVLARFCEAYLGRHDPAMVARVRLFSASADWAAIALWLVAASLADTNDDYDYDGEMASSLRRARTVVDRPDHGRLLEQARR